MRHISLLLALVALLTSELRAAEPNTATLAATAAPTATLPPTATLRPGDVFNMRLTGMPPDLIADITNLEYTVGPDGIVNIPLIGKMKVSSLNSTQVEDAIQAKFIAGKFFTNPTVIINVAQGARFVSISGGVRNPQRLQWTSDMTLTSAIGNCQDLNDFASGKGIRVIRDGKVFGTFNYKEITKDPAKDPKLLPGDQVTVPQ
jgi:polysaccharide biosynthesis/export protein